MERLSGHIQLGSWAGVVVRGIKVKDKDMGVTDIEVVDTISEDDVA